MKVCYIEFIDYDINVIIFVIVLRFMGQNGHLMLEIM